MVYGMGSFARALDALISEHGISVSALARRVPCDRALICRYRNGRQKPSAKMARRLDDILGAAGELVALAASDPPTRRAVLAGGLLAGGLLSVGAEALDRVLWAQERPAHTDVAAADALADVLASQRRAEDALGSAALVGPVTTQMAAVEDLVKEARGSARPAVLNVAQQWVQFAAWLHMSTRDFPAAQALWRQVLELAAEAGDATMTASALTYRAEMAGLAGHASQMISLAAAAQRDPHASAVQLARSAGIEARGHAMTGDGQAAERKLEEASTVAGRGGAAPPWLYWCTPQHIEGNRGIALGYLAGDERYRSSAIEALTAAYAGPGANMANSEWGSDFLLYRAAVHARGGDAAEACGDALRVVPVWRQTSSASLGTLLTELRAGLAARFPGHPKVAELAEALR
jgi:transcriptional regulator with XRE-family HTH domain